MANQIAKDYGSLVFSDSVMKERLPKSTYYELASVIKKGKALNPDIAHEVAHAMKDWALEQGATHFTHWFQPLTGITSEKHDSFVTLQEDGSALLTFSGAELIQGEPDASSFPSGGLRATCEARGYTAWDPTSPAFIKDNVLCIPTAFISYTGEALDKKTPLLRSCVAIDHHAKRVLAFFGKTVTKITTTVGPEQEYFLIREDDFAARPDLILTGRTLFGCKPAKGQELAEHYFGTVRPTVSAFMKELDRELWKLGVPAKTKHNEAAPCQHELAPTFEAASVAIDNNLLMMEKMRIIASHHKLVCLEHEKPFEYVNGSGKHNNWSISADGKNLLDPSDTPEDNLQFLVFLACTIAAVATHQDLMRVSIATLGNDHRLGSHEAPPAIISVFLGEDITAIINSLIQGTPFASHTCQKMDLGVPQLADVSRDAADRNRTSPFAFTGNKFEFRMCGSQQNLSDPNMILNTAVAEQLDNFANIMESVAECDFVLETLRWLKETLTKHQHIIFNGNNYSKAWEVEAQKRGLLNMSTTPDALPCLIEKKNIDFFEKYGVLSESETHARYVAKSEQYVKHVNIEVNTMVYMARHLYLPALFTYSGDVAKTAIAKREIGIEAQAEKELVARLTDGIDTITAKTVSLEEKNARTQHITNHKEQCDACRDFVIPAMKELRKAVDDMEYLCGHDYWPVPSYNRMLFYI